MCANEEINNTESHESCEGDIHSAGRVWGFRDGSREELTFKPKPQAPPVKNRAAEVALSLVILLGPAK